jgi:uncharacterized protein YdhG (YjbR/CyaY superfamily)
VSEYLAGATPAQRAALNKVRRAVKAAAPSAVESISYGLVGFKYKNKPLIGLAYWKEHLALYGSVALGGEAAKKFALDKGTLRFTPERSVPDRLVTKIVRARKAVIDKAG